MESNNKAVLTSSELANIWGGYMNASLNVAVLSYYKEIVEDEEILPVVNYAFNFSQDQVNKLSTILKNENHPVPHGFTNEDVNLNAPKLYTDIYLLQNSLTLGTLGLNACAMAIGSSTREDIYTYFSNALQEFNELHRMARAVALSKGVYTRPPSIPTTEEVDYVKKQNFLSGWFGDRRPLLAVEISHLFSNIGRNTLGAATLTGFTQVTQSKEVKSYLKRGIEIAKKHVTIFSEVLEDSNVSVPMGSDAMVTDSHGISPFSDKLIMFHTTGMISQGIGFYGFAISTSSRRDLSAHYARLSAEIVLYSEDGINIMIDNEWLEEPPRMIDRDELANTYKRKE
ncbi:DUF3231 family protein [Virgibacillus sp. C22-A2]|uniref:DUF3231 family protein n=1 Tax=Virgibacillus tibetensis TaxID=3042313 RepID=A0ABU6KL95_9BACI|nr:DUF3231 family protein [Virgibacillus sp. C22-A2]